MSITKLLCLERKVRLTAVEYADDPGGRRCPVPPTLPARYSSNAAEDSGVSKPFLGGLAYEAHVLDEDVQCTLGGTNSSLSIRSPRSWSMKELAAPCRIASKTKRGSGLEPRRRPGPLPPPRCAPRRGAG